MSNLSKTPSSLRDFGSHQSESGGRYELSYSDSHSYASATNTPLHSTLPLSARMRCCC